jgi:hypothetical protein
VCLDQDPHEGGDWGGGAKQGGVPCVQDTVVPSVRSARTTAVVHRCWRKTANHLSLAGTNLQGTYESWSPWLLLVLFLTRLG